MDGSKKTKKDGKKTDDKTGNDKDTKSGKIVRTPEKTAMTRAEEIERSSDEPSDISDGGDRARNDSSSHEILRSIIDDSFASKITEGGAGKKRALSLTPEILKEGNDIGDAE